VITTKKNQMKLIYTDSEVVASIVSNEGYDSTNNLNDARYFKIEFL